MPLRASKHDAAVTFRRITDDWWWAEGDKESLLAQGVIDADTELPAGPCGCRENETDKRKGVNKVSMLKSGLLRVHLNAQRAARCDPEYRKFLSALGL